MNWPGEPVLLEGVRAREYFADAFGESPTLSRSIGHTLVTVSRLHAAAEHPRLKGTAVRRQSEEMDLGLLIHALLGGDLGEVDVHDVPDWRGKRADLRDASRAAGLVPIRLCDFEKAAAASEILKPEICLQLGRVAFPCPACNAEGYCGVCGGSGAMTVPAWDDLGRELVCLYEEEGGVRVRQRWDLYWPAAALIADPKVVTGGRYATAGGFIRQLNGDYDSGAMQAASYLRGLSAVHPELAGRETFVFLRLEAKPPYAVVPIVVTQGLRDHGERLWERAVRGWARCMASGVWPGPGVAYAQLLPWAAQGDLDQAAEDGDTALAAAGVEVS